MPAAGCDQRSICDGRRFDPRTTLQQFQEFVDSLKEQLENLIGSMTHKLEVDFQA